MPHSPARRVRAPLPVPSPLKSKSKEERLQMAIVAMHDSGYKPNGHTKLTFRNAEKLFGISRSTLEDRFKGKTQPAHRAHEAQQVLTHAQEAELAKWARHMSHRGIPLTKATLRDYAMAISGQQIGLHWVERFMERQKDTLKVKWTQALEKCRAQALNPTAVKEFFEELIRIVERYDIRPENIYNMDEKGVQLGVGGSIAAIVDRDLKMAYNVEEGSREHVTILEAACADGFVLRPSVVFNAQRINLRWVEQNPDNASVSCSPNGWTDQDLGQRWLEKDFHPQTKERNTSDGYRLLILDGHNSHCTYPFVVFAEKHRIIILCLPAHTTHALQPCDVGIFGPLASCWKRIVNEAARNNIVITKENFLEFYARARAEAMKETTVQAAFAKTGIWPMNADAIPTSMFEPSKNTSTQAVHPFNTISELLQPVTSSTPPPPGPTAIYSENAPTPISTPSNMSIPPLSTVSTSSTTSTLSTSSNISVASTVTVADEAIPLSTLSSASRARMMPHHPIPLSSAPRSATPSNTPASEAPSVLHAVSPPLETTAPLPAAPTPPTTTGAPPPQSSTATSPPPVLGTPDSLALAQDIRYTLAGLPDVLHHRAGKEALQKENKTLRDLLEKA